MRGRACRESVRQAIYQGAAPRHRGARRREAREDRTSKRASGSEGAHGQLSLGAVFGTIDLEGARNRSQGRHPAPSSTSHAATRQPTGASAPTDTRAPPFTPVASLG
jgi:hypothetical protein